KGFTAKEIVCDERRSCHAFGRGAGLRTTAPFRRDRPASSGTTSRGRLARFGVYVHLHAHGQRRVDANDLRHHLLGTGRSVGVVGRRSYRDSWQGGLSLPARGYGPWPAQSHRNRCPSRRGRGTAGRSRELIKRQSEAVTCVGGWQTKGVRPNCITVLMVCSNSVAEGVRT